MTQSDLKEYVHDALLNEEQRLISGYYEFTEEILLPFNGSEILFLLGHAILDTACCGATGCGYALVQGFIENRHFRTDDKGRPVSKILPIDDETMQKEIESLIKKVEMVQQVIFA